MSSGSSCFWRGAAGGGGYGLWFRFDGFRFAELFFFCCFVRVRLGFMGYGSGLRLMVRRAVFYFFVTGFVHGQ